MEGSNDQEKKNKKVKKITTFPVPFPIEKFKSTLKLNLNGSLAPAASLSIGYYYDQGSLVDSALKYYQFTIETYPDSEQSIIASERAKAISLALSIIKLDSASSSDLKSN